MRILANLLVRPSLSLSLVWAASALQKVERKGMTGPLMLPGLLLCNPEGYNVATQTQGK